MNLTVSSRRTGAWTAVGLFALTLLSRIPFRSQILYHWDSVNFGYAMREFSVAKEQPQPPGYIVYVWLCRLVDLLFGDAQTTMVWISVVASALAVVALFCLGRAMFNRQTGLIAALFLATSPLFWFYGEIALPHSLDMLLVIVGVWWLYETMRGQNHYLYPVIVALAVAGGVRPQTLVFLAPLTLFALRKVGWKRFIIAGGLGAAICVAWFTPLMAASGGIGAYLEAVGGFTERFNATTSVFMGGGWWGLRRNLIKLTMYTLFGWSIALLPFVGYAAARVRRREWLGNGERVLFCALWLAPTLIFYTLIHMGQQGLVFVFLPALLLGGAAGLVRLFASGSSRRLAVVAAALLAVNVALFCMAPEYPLGGDRLRLLTRAALINSDRYYQDRFQIIEENCIPNSTVILANDWHHTEYYLPEYSTLHFNIGSKWEKDEGDLTENSRQNIFISTFDLGLPLNSERNAFIILFDPALIGLNKTPDLIKKWDLKNDDALSYFELEEGQHFYIEKGFFGIVKN